MRPRAQEGKGKAIEARSNLSTSFEKHVRPKSREIGRSIGQPPRSQFEHRTHNIYSAPPPRLPPRPPVYEKKPVNWRLAGFMANEYLTRGTLLGNPWPPPSPQDPNTERLEKKDKSASEEESPESRKEKERLYYTLADSLRSGDVYIPGIVNPSQLAAWLGLSM